MKPLILAVVLAVMQAALPVPRQAADNPTGTSGHIKSDSGAKQQPTAQPVPVRNPNESPTAEGDAGQQGHNDAEHTVGISKLPPVSITRSWPDWGLWVFNGLLVLVGGFQVWLLLHTLRAIKRQADLMERQLELIIGKERARLVVELEPLELWTSARQWTVNLRVVNHGETKAFVRRAAFLPCIESSEWQPVGAELYYMTMKIPVVISPGSEGVRCDGPMQEGIKLHASCWDIGVETAKSVYADKNKLFVVGVIDYGDVFGNEWRLLFSQVWNPMFVTDGLPTYAEWRSYGPPVTNSEQRRQKRGPKEKPESFSVFPPN